MPNKPGNGEVLVCSCTDENDETFYVRKFLMDKRNKYCRDRPETRILRAHPLAACAASALTHWPRGTPVWGGSASDSAHSLAGSAISHWQAANGRECGTHEFGGCAVAGGSAASVFSTR